jgi:hypothetical protein
MQGPEQYHIYDKEQIETARKSPEWSREFEGQYLGLIGNVFSTRSLELCQELGNELDIDKIPINQYSQKSR